MSNNVFELLRKLRVIDDESVTEYHPRVRDRDDIKVLRCDKTGVIFLSGCDHMNISHYQQKEVDGGLVDGTEINSPTPIQDDRRRAEYIIELVKNRRWLDIGTGFGGILDLLKDEAAGYAAVEPNPTQRELACSRNHPVFGSIKDLSDGNFDIVTMFHVFEHIVDPIDMLEDVKTRLSTGGRIIIEVPHARDFLLTTLASEAFKDFTFWSEHLVLHTRQSLETLLRHAGFNNINITGYQRYPLSNHLYWLSKEKPGGHKDWSFLNDQKLEEAYSATLARLDKTDTLIAEASL